MFRGRSPFDLWSNTLKSASWLMLAPGLTLIGLGVLIWIVPDLLRFIVAAAFVFVGAIFVTMGLHTRRAGRGFNQMRDDFQDPTDNVRDGTP